MKVSRLLFLCSLAVAMAASGQLSNYSDKEAITTRVPIKESIIDNSKTITLRKLPVRERDSRFGRNLAASTSKAKPSAIALPKDADPDIDIWGSLIYITLPEGTPIPGRDLGVVSFSPNGSFTTLKSTAGANGGGIFQDGVFYCVKKIIRDIEDMHIDFVSLSSYDMNTWEELSFEQVGHELIATDVTWDPVTDNMYGCFYSEDLSKFQFGVVDYKNKTRTTLCDLPVALNAIAADKDGTLYAVDLNGNFCTIDKQTGKKHIIGKTGCVPYYVTSADIDKRTGTFYWTVCPSAGNSFLCTVDKTTGKATKVLDFPYDEEISTLYIPTPAAEDDAPAAVAELACTFLRGSLSGVVSFTMPSTLYGGAVAEGEAGYVVLMNGNKIADGWASYGSQVSLDVTAECAGEAKFVIYAYNEAGEGPRVRSDVYLGKGTPKAPENVTLSNAEGTMTLKWSSVTESVNKGYLDVDNITYNVTRYPGAEIVASGITDTTFVESVEIPYDYTVYYYTVESVSDGMVSVPAASNSIAMGGIHPPYTDDFSDAATMSGWIIEDSNTDDSTWKAQEGEFAIAANYASGMDDWLFSPGVEFDSDKLYRIDLEVSGSIEGCPEHFEVKVGAKPESEAMIDVVIDTLVIGSTKPMTISGYLYNMYTSTVHIGIHAISQPFTGGLHISRVHISEPCPFTIPNGVDNVVLKRGYNTIPLVDIKFTAPDLQADGEDIASLTKIEVWRNDAGVVKVFDNPAPGSNLNFTDEIPGSGFYTYTFVPFSESGEGIKNYASISVEAGTPATPAEFTATEASDAGKVKLQWSAVTTDTEGYPLEKNSVSYTLVEINGGQQDLVADNLKVTSYTYRAVPRGEQAFKQYAVSAITSLGESVQKISNLLAVGTPYGFPYSESLAETRNSSIIAAMSVAGESSWQMANDSSFGDIASFDHDNGYFVMVGSSVGDASQLQFGKVSLAGAVKPVVSFYSYNIAGDVDDMNNISVLIRCNGEWKVEGTIVECESADSKPGWHRTVVDLSAYAGQTIELALVGTLVTHQYILVDAVSICNFFDNDISASSISVPDRVKPGKDFKITAKAVNYGLNDAENVSAVLLRNGEAVASKPIELLAAGQSATVIFTDALNVSYSDAVAYSVEFGFAADDNPDDNTTSEAKVAVDKQNLPIVKNFCIIAIGNEAKLSWGTPDYEGSSTEVRMTDDFEDYPSFANSGIGDWTLVDADDDQTFGIGGIEFPGITKNMPLSYFVLDTELQGLNETWVAHSGTKYLSNIGAVAETCDDWLISPQLTGKEQTVSFYARSYNPSYLESFEFLYSTTGIATDDFISLDVQQFIGSDWTEYAYSLPAGAKYFAIRCISYDALMFQIDDVTYSRFADGDNVLLGYNVYCNNVLLTQEPIEGNAYTAAFSSPDDEFAVSAVYTAGESDAVRGTVSGVDAIGNDGVQISAHKGCAIVNGAAGMTVEVFSADGCTVFAGECEETSYIPLQQGIYVVNVGKGATVKKIIVD